MGPPLTPKASRLTATAGRFAPEFWSVVDQGLFSGSNFLLALYCARVVTVEDYGIFATGFAVFLLLAGFHNALVLEPMCVLAPKNSAFRGSEYVHVMERHHLVGSGLVICFTLLVLLFAAIHSSPFTKAVVIAAATTPVLLYQWLMRRSCYVWLTPKSAALGSVVYAAALALASFGFVSMGLRSYLTPFLAMGSAAAASAAAMRLRFQPSLPDPVQLSSATRSVWRSHWTYSKWILPVAILFWLSDAAFPTMLMFTSGAEGAASYRASENLFLPLVQALASMCLLNLPRLSNRSALEPHQLQRFATRAGVGALIVGATYSLLVACNSQGLVDLIYSGQSYSGITGVIPWLALAVVVRGICDLSLATPIRAIGDSRAVFISALIGAISTCCLGFILMTRYGWPGAIVTRAISALLQFAVLLWLFRRAIASLSLPQAAASGSTALYGSGHAEANLWQRHTK